MSKILICQEFFEVWRVGALFLHLDHIANLHLHGRNVSLLAIDGEVIVNNHLTAFTTGFTKTSAENNVVETLFEHDDQVFTCRTFQLLSFFKVVSERLFHYAIDEFGFLLFLQLHAVFALFLAHSLWFTVRFFAVTKFSRRNAQCTASFNDWFSVSCH